MKSSLALIGLIVLVAAGCGGSGKKSSANTTTSSSGKSGKKIGLVTDIGGLNDRGFNHLSYVGLLRAQSELGIQQQVFQAKSTQDYVPNLSTFARKGYALTIGVGFTEATAMDTVATTFPKSNFAIVDVDQTEEPHKPANLLGLLFREQETGYLVGYLAGLEEKRRPGKDVIGSVGGQKQPPVDRFIAGYQAGAKAADPGITTLNGYSEDFSDLAKC
ncbi:MAG: BMP family ABC transporter substrate-binding protein, partial [Gaiellaceae bacterium]